ncbi:hypothetical protein GCM10009839_34980 [Catenulispora yoronensis]|uniref:EthD domain-containing protein n=1 Tax=Catenulispora yoronensis TaxID=450799 RepID=A0ABP5FUF9_9ACTN
MDTDTDTDTQTNTNTSAGTATTTARFYFYYEQPTDPAAFDRHYRDVHIPLARRLPGLRSYTITDNAVAVRGEAFFRVAELCWDSMEDLQASFASPEGLACAQDVENLLRYTDGRAVIVGAPESLL